MLLLLLRLLNEVSLSTDSRPFFLGEEISGLRRGAVGMTLFLFLAEAGAFDLLWKSSLPETDELEPLLPDRVDTISILNASYEISFRDGFLLGKKLLHRGLSQQLSVAFTSAC